MPTTVRTIQVSDFRKTCRDVFEAVSKGQRYEVVCHGKVVGFIMGPAEWMMMNETLDILTNRDLMAQIIASEKDFEEGASRPAEEVFDEIEKELEEDE